MIQDLLARAQAAEIEALQKEQQLQREKAATERQHLIANIRNIIDPDIITALNLDLEDLPAHTKSTSVMGQFTAKEHTFAVVISPDRYSGGHLRLIYFANIEEEQHQVDIGSVSIDTKTDAKSKVNANILALLLKATRQAPEEFAKVKEKLRNGLYYKARYDIYPIINGRIDWTAARQLRTRLIHLRNAGILSEEAYATLRKEMISSLRERRWRQKEEQRKAEEKENERLIEEFIKELAQKYEQLTQAYKQDCLAWAEEQNTLAWQNPPTLWRVRYGLPYKAGGAEEDGYELPRIVIAHHDAEAIKRRPNQRLHDVTAINYSGDMSAMTIANVVDMELFVLATDNRNRRHIPYCLTVWAENQAAAVNIPPGVDFTLTPPPTPPPHWDVWCQQYGISPNYRHTHYIEPDDDYGDDY